MSEKFTQGPWFWDFDLCDEEGPLDEPMFNGRILDQDNMIVCEAAIDANAHLISAAPEMYEALQAILQYVPISSASEGGAVARSGNVIAADKVRAALKKARGES